MKKIKLTKELFFNTLPKLKKYKPVLTRTGFIRFGKRNKGYEMCPLTALRKELTGIAGDIYKVEDYFPNSSVAEQIVQAADDQLHSGTVIKYRNEMIKVLGL